MADDKRSTHGNSSPPRPLKSTAKEWPGAARREQRYRDRKRITLPDGAKLDVVGYGPTKKAATEALYMRVTQALAAHQSQSAAKTVTQVLAALVMHKRTVRGRKRKTIHNDLDLFRRHVQPHIGHLPITDVTLADLEAIQTRLTTAGKWRTAELVTIQLRSIYKHALRIYRDDARAGRLQLFDQAEDLEPVRRPAEAKHKPNEPWTVDQLALFLTEAKNVYDASLRNLLYPVFHAAIAAGLRRGELLGLRRSDLITTPNGTHLLRVEHQYVYYAGKHHADTPKSASGQREVPIGPELVAVLEEHMRKVDRVARLNPEWSDGWGLLFPSFNGTPLQPRSLYRARDELLKSLAERGHELPKATLHELRGVYATYLTRKLAREGRYNPKIVQRTLGHSHPLQALEHYNRVVQEDLAAAVFDPLVRVGPERVTNGVTNLDVDTAKSPAIEDETEVTRNTVPDANEAATVG